MGDTMNEHVAVFRNEEGMQTALKTILKLKERFAQLAVRDSSKVFNTSLLFTMELGFMLDVAETICVGALARKESRGAHYRTDMPERDDENWLRHILVHASPEGPSIDYLPVVITKWQPEARSY
jgi:succinate dehydrogenase/fumarate reductase flavoprotein subunit